MDFAFSWYISKAGALREEALDQCKQFQNTSNTGQVIFGTNSHEDKTGLFDE
jgi:hypothetical protein